VRAVADLIELRTSGFSNCGLTTGRFGMLSQQNCDHRSLPLRSGIASLFAAALLMSPLKSVADDQSSNDSAAARRFSDSVLPLLKKHCYECHSHESESAEGGLVLDSRGGWKVGGDSGPAIVPGSPAKSRLLKAVEYSDSELQMPPDSKLAASDIAILKRWIVDGAFDPRVGESRSSKFAGDPVSKVKGLWSLKPVAEVKIPTVIDEGWVRNDVDRFILAKLGEQGLTPNRQADRYALLRRATFDLTGLPPTLGEIEKFVSDKRPDAYRRLIERLLESPHYGERWGRHWLDLARYGDSNGGDINCAHANAWKYRDYVIQAFNDDTPYDEFVREQLAGDLLPDGGNEDRRGELLTATGFLMLGPKMLAEADTDKLLIDIVDEQLDVVGLTFLGMTFGCARCHDHKFDPISTEDYYAMAGIFRSTKVIGKYRTPGGVAEWLEVDVTRAETRVEIKELNDEKNQLVEVLAGLGASMPAKGNSRKEASKAIVATKLQKLNSTTWAAWARISTPQTSGAVVSATYKGANQGHSLGFDNGSTPRVVWNHGSAPHTIIAAAKPIPLDEWHHLALTFDAAEERLRLLVDGEEAASASNVATSPFSTISVGRREASQEWQFTGDIDEVRVFDSALDESEILALFRNESTQQKPLLFWSFDEPVPDSADNLIVGRGQGSVVGRLVGLSRRSSVVEDGVLGSAFSFSKVTRVSPADVERKSRITEIRMQLSQLEAKMPQSRLVMAVDSAEPVNLPIHIRGNHTKLASAAVVRSTPQVFNETLRPVTVPATENGRRQLADWIASRKNPLTARVMVNRIWQHHFGTGLVRTPSNFGVRGEQPTHPQLLDWLANEFVETGWSIKHMHRLIMNSATYRQSSRIAPAMTGRDPENRLLGRFPIRRLEAEAIRDSLLAVAGELDRTIGGSLFKAENMKRVTTLPTDPVYGSSRRSVYLPSVRVRSYQMFSIFDVSDSGQHVAQRSQTMVAQQALFLMNNPFVIDRAKVLAGQLMSRSARFEEQLDWLHRTLFGRPATDREAITLSAAFTELTDEEMPGRKDSEAGALSVWQHIIHTMLCSNEFIHIR
jgi:hypothetical protein